VQFKNQAHPSTATESVAMKQMNEHAAHPGRYGRLLAMTVLSFLSMYVLMYAMVNAFGNVYSSLNQVYMAGLMTAPMVIIELLLMGSMYPNKIRNRLILATSVIALGLCWVLIRQQVGISDRQFLRSMIPHHAGAILMCENSSAKSSEIVRLCREIVASQQSEIALMTSLLKASD
jgi:hypothetical protein